MFGSKTMLALAALSLAVPVAAESYTTDGNPQIVERNAKGKATKVSVDGTTYSVCMTERQDNCIQPRAAGLNWGDIPLRYWPGQTSGSASTTGA